ncbi:hypothetical protein [Streptomyces violaceusniger]|uniref:hypothetical protein n=1 Tax=Streptomyces violaceusniger TaxID=68280 RepID=UPI0037FF7122
MTALAPILDWGDLPDGTLAPKLDTLVLLNRDLRPDTDLSKLSRFGDDCWDLNPAVFEDHMSSMVVNFTLLPIEMRLAAKFYVWQLLNHTEARTFRRAGTGRIAVRTVANAFLNGMKFVLEWFAEQGVTEFCQVTDALLDDYLVALLDHEVPLERCYRRITEIRRLLGPPAHPAVHNAAPGLSSLGWCRHKRPARSPPHVAGQPHPADRGAHDADAAGLGHPVR